MNRRIHQNTSLIAAGLLVAPVPVWAADNEFSIVRPPEAKRKFKCPAVEKPLSVSGQPSATRNSRGCLAIVFRTRWTPRWTSRSSSVSSDTYVITGDIDVMGCATARHRYGHICRSCRKTRSSSTDCRRHQPADKMHPPDPCQCVYKDENKVKEWKVTSPT